MLVSGCSYTHNKPWPIHLFPNKKYQIKNLAQAGAGNTYISNSITGNLDYKPDFVFILWSGINRFDFRVPNSKTLQRFVDHNEQPRYTQIPIEHSRYYLSGGSLSPEFGMLTAYNNIKADHWPIIHSLEEWFNLPSRIKQECMERKIYLATTNGDPNLAEFYHQYFLVQDIDASKEYRSELTFQNIVNCGNLLDKLKIPYRFSFIYDIFAEYNHYSFGQAVKETYYKYVNWGKCIKLYPFEFGLKNDLIDEDGFHLTSVGYEQWGKEISTILKQDSELAHLF